MQIQSIGVVEGEVYTYLAREHYMGCLSEHSKCGLRDTCCSRPKERSAYVRNSAAHAPLSPDCQRNVVVVEDSGIAIMKKDNYMSGAVVTKHGQVKYML